MIINDSKKVCFVHIPKCAGTSIRSLIQEFDDLNGAHTGRVEVHDELGLLDYVHIPLPVLSEHFPELYSKVKSYYSFAIIRDPYQRFASSIAQRLKKYGKKGLKDISNDELIKEIDNCINFLNDHAEEKVLLPAEYIHFQRQSSYIYNEEKIVNDLFLIDDIDKCLSTLKDLFEIEVEKSSNKGIHENKSLVYRSKLFFRVNQCISAVIPKSILIKLVKLIKFCIPRAIILKLKKVILVPKSSDINEIFNTENVKTFIERYYKKDIELYNSLKRDARNL